MVAGRAVVNGDCVARLWGCWQAEAALIAGLNPDEDAVDARIGAAVKTLWADAGIQAAYEMRSKFQLNDSAA